MKFESNLQEGNGDVIATRCGFRPYKGFSDFGLVPFDDSPVVTDSATALIGPQCLSDTNPSGVPCHLGPLKPHDVAPDHSNTLGKEEEPYTFQQFHASTSIPYVWGSYCKQYNWPEDERGRNRFANGFEYFAGSWRNENETWMFLADITTCPCYPQCAKCEEKVPGTVNLRRIIPGAAGKACLAQYDTDVASCNLMLRGVSGGAHIYYDDPKLPSGEFQRCYTYATIEGYRRVASPAS